MAYYWKSETSIPVSPLIILLTCSLITKAQVSQDICEDQADCIPIYGEQSECEDGLCRCKDYFELGRAECVMYVRFGRPCNEPAQCQGALGPMSSCNTTTRLCECSSPTGLPLALVNEKCQRKVSMGEACANHDECFAGTLDEFSRCVDAICQCYSDQTIQLTLDGSGKCIMESTSAGTTISLSVFAVCIALSVTLFVLVVLIYRVTSPYQNRGSKGSRMPETLRSSASSSVMDEHKNSETTSPTPTSLSTVLVNDDD